MFCVQESEGPLSDPFASVTEPDPLNTQKTQSESSDEEPDAKRPKMEISTPSLNLKVYQIPPYNGKEKDYTIYPTTPANLPKFVNNPLNLANPLAFATNALLNKHQPAPQQRHSLPNLPKTPPAPLSQNVNKNICDSGSGVVRYKKNGEIAKKRGPPKGYKRKPKDVLSIQNLTNNMVLQAQNTILTSLLATSSSLMQKHLLSKLPPGLTITPQLMIVPTMKIPDGVELVELLLDPADWFPEEPYKMIFSRKKNPKWKQFPYRCEHCFKGYRVPSTLVAHAAARHGCAPRALCVACPCCPHVSARRRHHARHLLAHAAKKGRIFCLYCLPMPDPDQPFQKESEKYPFEEYPQFWYASEESLRLHKKRKHPYAAMYNYNWFGTWLDTMPNS